MDKDTLQKLIDLRQSLVEKFSNLRDFRANKNAIMKEEIHARSLHAIIVSLDDILKGHVEFSD